MKNLIIFFLLILYIPPYLFAGTDINCETNIINGSVYASTGGKFKPSANAPGQYFRVLFVFAQFASDNVVIPNWTKGSLPTWANDLIDTSPSSSYRSNTVSDYFKKMSDGDYDVVGDIHPTIITVPTNQPYWSANQYVLGQLNSQITNFKRYDNWKLQNGVFVFSPSNGDGYLDLVHIIYRWADGNSLSQWFYLGGGVGQLNPGVDFLTHDGVHIYGSGADVYGSGITTNTNGTATNNINFVQHFAHEFGHYLFGSGHNTEAGLMQGDPYGYDGITYAMNAWERVRLGYTSFFDGYNGYTKTLRDYVTTGDAIKVQINSDEILVIENHQRVSPYDQPMRGGAQQGGWDQTSQLGKGIYVYYIKNAGNYPNTDFILGADGGWDWQFAGYINMPQPGWPAQLPLIDKGNAYRYLPNQPGNQKGKSDRNPWLKVNGLSGYFNYRWHSRDPITNQWVLSRSIMGDETDAFNIDYNQILSPWSNPSTTKFIGSTETPTNISMQLVSQATNGDITLNIYTTYSGSLALPPSKPQSLVVSPYYTEDNAHPKLTWEANTEPDVISYSQGYLIERKIDNGSYSQIAAVSGTTTQYIDYGVGYAAGGPNIAYYKIRAKDTQGLTSVYSDGKSIRFGDAWKIGADNEIVNNVISDYKLFENYPNPFNPSTQINYSVKQDGFVTLKVYDVLGNEVASLVKEPKEQGTYSASFNASNLPSGVYIYTIKVNEFSASKKMLMLK